MDNITYSPNVAIRARYLGPTNYRGSRFRVWRADGTWQEDPDRIEVSFDHGLSQSDRARDLIARYLANKGDNWQGHWVVAGASDSDYIAIKVSAR